MSDERPKVTGKEAVVLRLLSDHQQWYGMEMVEATYGELKEGTIYATLHRMEGKGLVSSQQEDKPANQPGMPKRMYKINEVGWKAYQHLMGAGAFQPLPVVSKPVNRDEVEVQFMWAGPGESYIPAYQTDLSAGIDLQAALATPIPLAHGSAFAISAGFALAIPPGYEGQVRPRSGLALNRGITVLNSPGTIDADYRGVVSVILMNHGPAYHIKPGDRIAQLVIAPVSRASFTVVEELPDTERGEGGFGSTGK